MSFATDLTQAARHQRVLMKHRPDKLWLRLLLVQVWTLGFGSFFAVVSGLQHQNLFSADWWRQSVPGNFLVSLCVTLTFFTLFRSFERLAPQRWIDTISGWRDWRSGLFFSGLSTLCVLIGLVIGLAVADQIWIGRSLAALLGNPAFWQQFILVSAVISIVIGWRYRARWKREALQARITEAQLRLLQGQIEPHFLFNTLANVQSLIDFNPTLAKQMLERFTDYLRASLGQLRGESTTLAQEFAMLEAYLSLMQLRMGQRLQVRLDLPPDLADFALPPLLVQPLVENAIHHGLEPRIDGGTVTVTARRLQGQLCIEVEDDGQGLDAPRRPSTTRSTGHGMALANIRERLAARWGSAATLDLQPRTGGGTCARFCLPFTRPLP